jgi:hypothetical protein
MFDLAKGGPGVVRFLLLGLLVATAGLHGAEAPLRVLFIGNSYTYYNNLAGMVEGLSAGRIQASAVTRGGATLGELYTLTDAREVLRASRWDVVVLQEQSTLGVSQFNGDMVVNDPAGFFTWARIWDEEIRRAGARTVFYNAWARKGRAELQGHLDWAHGFIARELGAELLPVGAAFGLAGGVELFASDGTHPSAAGSYLAACVAVMVLVRGECADRVEGVLMDNEAARLREERGALVSLAASEAEVLRRAAAGAVARLGENGQLARPVFAGEDLAAGAGGDVAGRWEGTVWLYGRQANVTLQLNVDGAGCSGTWTVFATEPPTSTVLPLEGCSVADGRARFTVRTLFLTAETHEAWVRDGALQGRMALQGESIYRRQGGSWTLQRGKSVSGDRGR